MTETQKLKSINDALKKKFGEKRLVLGRGSADARVVVVGEAPGTAEEKEGKPIAGDPEKVLNRLLKVAGLKKHQVYVTNVLKYAASTTNAPSAKEIKSHALFLREEIRAINPRIVVTLGNLALNGIGLRQPLDNVHGRMISLGNHELFATFHPKQALDDPQVRTSLEADFIKLKDILNAQS